MVECTGVFGDDTSIATKATLSYNKDSVKDVDKLIDLLIRQNHMSVFEFASMEFYVEVPIYTQRQWMRHRTTFIEKSLRYTEPEDCYIPESVKKDDFLTGLVVENYKFCLSWYKMLIQNGIPKEDARAVLPLSTYTKFYWSVNLRQLMNFLDQRLLPSAQNDIRNNAKEVEECFKEHFPITHKYWKKRKNPFES